MPSDDTQPFTSEESGGFSTVTDMISASDFVSGTSVRWRALATTITGGFFLLVTLGVTSIVQAITGAYVMLFGGVSGFVTDVVDSIASVPVDVAGAAWRSATAFVIGFGSISPLLAMLIGLVAVYVIMEGIYG